MEVWKYGSTKARIMEVWKYGSTKARIMSGSMEVLKSGSVDVW